MSHNPESTARESRFILNLGVTISVESLVPWVSLWIVDVFLPYSVNDNIAQKGYSVAAIYMQVFGYERPSVQLKPEV